MIGEVIIHYEIIEKLGEGGMGVVYKAHDTKLERDVAIKFLPRQVAANSEERERFKVEAKAAAALNHPNIAHIYAIEEVDDEMFIVMEYIEGRELRDIVGTARDAPMPIDDVLNYATQIADGLQAAHKKGVTHRDIKNANIMITEEGQVKIMDFGLAKVRGSAQLTKVGTTLGTAAYMSPEQARGEEADERADIWSFGVVLYEMLTAQLPFKGDYEQAVIYSILNEEPELPNEVPVNFQQILQKALAKDRSERYKHVDELRNDLSQVRETKALKATAKVRKKASFTRHRLYFGFAILLILLTVSGLAYFLNRSKPIDSIAVLPFVNSNNDPDIEYLGDGITETLITKLSLLPQLRVMARSTVFRFKGKDVTPQQVGEQLNVRAVLMGEIVQRDDVLRLNAELVDVSDGAQIWGDQYNRTLDDIFAVQDAISEQISTGLRLKLSRKEKSRLDKQYTEDPEAYQLYLKGRFHWNKRTVQDLNTALDYFQQAVNRDPTYALAYAGMADCYVLLPLNAYSGLSGKEAYPKAKAAALQALQIDEQLAEAHTALAMTYLYFDKDTVSAKKSFLLAIELNSNYATGHHWYAIEYLSRPGHHDKAIAEMKRALTLDPLSLVINGDLGWAYWRAGYYDLALEQFQNTIRMDQNFYLAYWGLGWTHIAMGEIAKAIEPLQQASQLSDTPKIVASLGYAYGITGGTEGAKKTLVQLDELSSRREVTPIEFAMIYAGLGDKDKAIEFLQRGLKQVDIDQQQAWLPHWDDYNLFWDNLRDDARFVELLKKVGLEK